MAKMKKGTFVALDKNYWNICVGDQVKDAEGFIYKIDAYGRAVKNTDRTTHSISSLNSPELYRASETKSVEAPAESEGASVEAQTAPENTDAVKAVAHGGKKVRTPRKRKEPRSKGSASAQVTLAEATDQMLADELRRRGYKLTAKKTVNIKL